MKIRTAFVSNSSSSSFMVINKKENSLITQNNVQYVRLDLVQSIFYGIGQFIIDKPEIEAQLKSCLDNEVITEEFKNKLNQTELMFIGSVSYDSSEIFDNIKENDDIKLIWKN